MESVEPQKDLDGKAQWIVSAKDLETDNKFSKIYDAVMVCNG